MGSTIGQPKEGVGRKSIAWIVHYTKLTAAIIRQEFSHAGGENDAKTKKRVSRVPPFVMGSQTADVLGSEMQEPGYRQALPSGFEQVTRRQGGRSQKAVRSQMVGPIKEAPKLFVTKHRSRANATPGGRLLGAVGFPGLWEVNHVKPW